MNQTTHQNKKTPRLIDIVKSSRKISHFVLSFFESSLKRASSLFTKVDSNFDFDNILDDEVTQTNKPEFLKHVIDKALQGKAFKKIELEIGTPEWTANIARRVLVKNIKQKLTFCLSSIPMFATLKEISIAKYTNSQVQIPLNLNLYFGLSLPAFVTLHIVEHILPIGKPRMAVQGLKVFTGIPVFVVGTGIDSVMNPVLRKMQIPLANTDMRGTMGVPSDITLKDVLREIQNEPYFKELDKKNLKKYLWENENKYDKLDKVFRKMHQMNHK